jgi:hypothetical protein
LCDPAGVSALVRAHDLAAAADSALRLALGDSPAARMIQPTGLDKIVPVYRDARPLTFGGPSRQAGHASRSG